jgi:hypothetical protein
MPVTLIGLHSHLWPKKWIDIPRMGEDTPEMQVHLGEVTDSAGVF